MGAAILDRKSWGPPSWIGSDVIGAKVAPILLRPACAYAQTDQSLCLSLEYYMSIKLLNEHNLEFLSLKEGYIGSSESIHVKMPYCWKSHDAAHLSFCKEQSR